MIKVLSVFGTRPEAIKMCPLIKEMEQNTNIKSVVCLTGQHRQMLEQVMIAFKIKEDYNLDIMREEQTLYTITADVISKMEQVLDIEKPDIVLVHGDTTTSFSVAVSAFYKMIPVGHVEAGLRTFDKYSPFPEEMNRKLISNIADIHFAPTVQNKMNLENEGVTKNIYVTGNTGIDAFKTTVYEGYTFENKTLFDFDFTNKKVIVVSAHRRENLGNPLENICNSILQIADEFEDVQFIYPVHFNPAVRNCVFKMLEKHDRIMLIDPINVMDMHNLISKSYLVLTDSGGIQEEAPHFGIPVLVLRTKTERPEAVKEGVVKVVGVEKDVIVEETKLLLTDKSEYEKMSKSINPYGDGNASKRIIDIILKNFCI